ncbi:hypothetical protein KBC04_01685 [Candidatus Babeliales bacterium]|nr:hypothetical protein [Candidatus Babeliales bacterium]MBP9843567.1 hypothetical protein [Candidatus Babeliales bacterium]
MKNLNSLLMVAGFMVFASVDATPDYASYVSLKDGQLMFGKRSVLDLNSQEVRNEIVARDHAEEVTAIKANVSLSKDQKQEMIDNLYYADYPKADVTLQQSVVGAALFATTVGAYVAYNYYNSTDASVVTEENVDKN